MSSRLNASLRNLSALTWGAVVGVLGGLIGLGGAEFRLPVLAGTFRFALREAIVINLFVSLATVFISLVARVRVVPFEVVVHHWLIIVNILAGSLLGSYIGVRVSTRVADRILHVAVVALLVVLSMTLMGHESLLSGNGLTLSKVVQIILGIVAGFGIGAISSVLGVAGGELIIPTIVILYNLDIRTAGSLSLAISIPTILMGLWRYHQHGQSTVLMVERVFIAWMTFGSLLGALLGAATLRFVSGSFLHAFLGVILLVSAWKMWRSHVRSPTVRRDANEPVS